ncbi:MAG: hypothetical protein AAFW65_07095 [Pseudomonadota bacterium]
MRRHALIGLIAGSLGACAVAGPVLETASDDTSCRGAEAAMSTLDAFMETFNSRDVAAWEGTFAFPHVRIAGGQVTVQANAGEGVERLFERLGETGWDYSAWISRDLVQCGDEKIHFATEFARYRADGSELARFQSLYVMTLVDGEWRVRARSSFAP